MNKLSKSINKLLNNFKLKTRNYTFLFRHYSHKLLYSTQDYPKQSHKHHHNNNNNTINYFNKLDSTQLIKLQ